MPTDTKISLIERFRQETPVDDLLGPSGAVFVLVFPLLFAAFAIGVAVKLDSLLLSTLTAVQFAISLAGGLWLRRLTVIGRAPAWKAQLSRALFHVPQKLFFIESALILTWALVKDLLG